MRKEVKAVVGTSATLSCEVAQAQTEVTWYKDGKKLSSSSKVHVEAKGCTRQLVVQQAGKADAGEYSCEAGGQKVSFNLYVTGQSLKVLGRACTPMIFPLDFISFGLRSSHPHFHTQGWAEGAGWEGVNRREKGIL